jgi:catalase
LIIEEDAMKDASKKTTKPPVMTTTAGAPVADNQNSVTAGPRGPVLMRARGACQGLGRMHMER